MATYICVAHNLKNRNKKSYFDQKKSESVVNVIATRILQNATGSSCKQEQRTGRLTPTFEFLLKTGTNDHVKGNPLRRF